MNTKQGCLNHYKIGNYSVQFQGVFFDIQAIKITRSVIKINLSIKNNATLAKNDCMEKLEHIGIAVKNLNEANKVFAVLLGKPHYKIEEVASEGVRTSFFEVGGLKIELLEATRADSPVAKFIEKEVKEFITWLLRSIT